MKHYVKDKVVIITGGSSGFGLETARMLLEMGAKVVITGRNEKRLSEAAADLGNGPNLLAVRADAVKTGDWKLLIETTLAKFGRIDVLVNNHGAGMKIANTEEMTDEDIQGILEVNIMSVIKGCREVVKVMKPQKSGRIVNVSSACAHRGWAGWGVYTAAKAAMVGFTRCLHKEMATWGGCASNFIPGAAQTDFCNAAQIDGSWLAGYPVSEDFARMIVNSIDLPDNTMIEEVRIWGTKQVHEMLNPY
ncbi:MAG: SDR family oxidoreductase [Thermoguttaceae bacterium]